MINLALFDRAILLTGPTASGKSELAFHLAEKIKGELISMDSMAIYRGMDIGTAKPTPEMRRQLPHRLVDCREPWESASVAWWLTEAYLNTHDILHRGKIPIIVGGTPLYLKAVLHGLFDGPVINPELRTELENQPAKVLYERLQPVDPTAASRIHPHDHKRLVRALEVYMSTGKTLSELQQQFKAELRPRNMPVFCMTLPRQELYRRIDSRVEAMMQAGWLEEVRQLMNLSRPLSREAAQAAGYRELAEHLLGKCTLEDAVMATKTRSRQLAKRQLTWFRSIPGLHELNALESWESHVDYISSMTAAMGSIGSPL